MSYIESSCFNSTSKVEDEDRLISYRSVYNKIRKLAMESMAKGDKKSNNAYNKVRKILEEAPAVKTKPVVRARWLKCPGGFAHFICSACGGSSGYCDVDGLVWESPFCPNCGAHMVEEG